MGYVSVAIIQSETGRISAEIHSLNFFYFMHKNNNDLIFPGKSLLGLPARLQVRKKVCPSFSHESAVRYKRKEKTHQPMELPSVVSLQSF